MALTCKENTRSMFRKRTQQKGHSFSLIQTTYKNLLKKHHVLTQMWGRDRGVLLTIFLEKFTSALSCNH